MDRSAVSLRALRSIVCLIRKIVALRLSLSSGVRSRELSMEYNPFFSVSSRRPALEKTSRGCFSLHIRTRFSRTSPAGPGSPMRFASRRKTALLMRSAVSFAEGRARRPMSVPTRMRTVRPTTAMPT